MPICFLDDRDAIAAKIQNLLQQAEKTYCIVAFWGRGAAQLFSGMTSKKIESAKIVCNLTMGGTNPDVIDELCGMGFDIRHNPVLHSKAYWTDKGVVVGSANASANGLSLEGRDQDGWLESAMFSDRRPELNATRKYVQKMWCKSDAITPQDMQKARTRWRERRPFPTPSNELTFMEALREGRFSGRRHCIFIVVDSGDLSDRNHMEKQANQLQQQYVDLNQRQLDAWEGYDDIPRGQYVISYWRGPRGGLQHSGVWKTLPEYCDRPGRSGLSYQFAYRVYAREIGMTGDQKNQLMQIIRCIVDNHWNWLQQQGCCIPLEELLEPSASNCLEQ